jgi:citrate lyase subunit beta/citryl-CoA lyase
VQLPESRQFGTALGNRETALRRSLLFVPGDDLRKLNRALKGEADTLVLDLEDAVAPERKEEARKTVANLLQQQRGAHSELAVRVNAADTPYFSEDLPAVVAAGAAAIMLPKCESAQDIARVAAAVEDLEAERNIERGTVKILALIESAAGILWAPTLAAATSRLEALCFGHVDFALDMGLPDSDPSTGIVHHARCEMALAAKTSKVAPIDHVCLAVTDEAAVRLEANAGVALGYEGKLCIHPKQVRVVNEVYTPTEAQIERALRIVHAAEEASAAGRNVFALDDKMIDAPVVAMQRKVLARARRAGLQKDD